MDFLRSKMNYHCLMAMIREVNRRLLSLTSRNASRKTCAFRTYSESHHLLENSAVAQKKSSSFSEMLRQRREQANRSFLVETSSKIDFLRICEVCEKIGPVRTMFHYSLENDKEVFLVECESSEIVQEVLKCSRYHGDAEFLPIFSRLLHLPPNSKMEESTHHTNIILRKNKQEQEFSGDTISTQMEHLYQNERLQDLGVRLRFLICQQFEDSLVGFIPHGEILPFGSSINGFGRQRCDLDMLLSLNNIIVQKQETQSGLYFNTKHLQLRERQQSQRILETIADMMRTFFPGIIHVVKILKARIPIVAFHHSSTDIECDFSVTNLYALHMSELLYLYGELDARVRPLVFTVRAWAKAIGLTNNCAGPWISNFTLTLMVLFFLQNRPVPVLPSLQTLVSLADDDDIRITDGVNCTFQRKIEKIPQTQNSEGAGALLLEFFIFYEKFNFSKHGLSLFAGGPILRPNGALYVENPLEKELNVSKNVTLDQTGFFQEVVRSAIWCLESNSSPAQDRTWGISKLFENHATKIDDNSKRKPLRVKFLFDKSQ